MVEASSLQKHLVRQVLFCPPFTEKEIMAQGGPNVELGFQPRVLAPNISQVLFVRALSLGCVLQPHREGLGSFRLALAFPLQL